MDPLDYRMDRGKHAGRTLAEVHQLDRPYLVWLATRGPLDTQDLAQAVLHSPPSDPEPFLDPWIDADEIRTRIEQGLETVQQGY